MKSVFGVAELALNASLYLPIITGSSAKLPMNQTQIEANRLIDGSTPMSSNQILEKLTGLGIDCTTIDHPPMFSVSDSKSLRATPQGQGDLKNLFLKNKKGQMWLVSCHEDQKVDLKALARGLSAGRFSFGSEQRLMEYLGVRPGSVSPLALINDRGCAVKFIIDSNLVKTENLYVHPLINTRTTTIRSKDLLMFASHIDHPVHVLDFD